MIFIVGLAISKRLSITHFRSFQSINANLTRNGCNVKIVHQVSSAMIRTRNLLIGISSLNHQTRAPILYQQMFVRVIIYSGFEHDRPTDREHLFSLLRRSPFPELSLTCRIPSLPNGDNEERETTSTKTTSTTMPTETTASVSLDHCFDLSHKNLSHPFSLIAQALILSLKTNITYIFLI